MPNDKGPNAQRIAFFFIHIQLEYLRLYQFVKLEYLRLYQFVKFYYRPQRSCGRGYVFTRVCDSVHGGGGLPQCMLGYCHPPRRRHPLAKETPQKETSLRRRHPLPPEGNIPRRRHPPVRRPPRRRHPLPRRPPRRKPPRPTPKEEIEGDHVQAHTQGGNWGGSDPGPHLRGKLRGIRSRPTPKGEIEGIRSRPTPKGEIEGDQIQAPPHAGIWSMSGRYASYWNAFLLKSAFPKEKTTLKIEVFQSGCDRNFNTLMNSL